MAGVVHKYLASPEGRKHQEIKSKREHIIRGLEQLLEDPRAAHEKALNEVVERFHQVAEENYTPLKRDAQLAQKLLELEREVLARIGDNTRDYVKDLAVA